MSGKMQIIILIGFLLCFLGGLIWQLREMKTPKYMKPRSFLKMHDNSDGFVSDTSADKFTVTHHYVECLFVEEQRGDANEIF